MSDEAQPAPALLEGSRAACVAPATSTAFLLSVRDAAAMLGVGLTAFRDRVAAELPHVRIGRRVLYDRRDLLRWIDARKVGGGEAPIVASTVASAVASPRAREILAGLRR